MSTDEKSFNERNIDEFRANHGRVSGRFEGAPLVILHTVGARSGKPRTNIMMYQADGGRYLIFASKAGADDNPAWYWNLKANPDARIEVGDDIVDVHATASRDSPTTSARRRAPSRSSRSRRPVPRSHAVENAVEWPVLTPARGKRALSGHSTNRHTTTDSLDSPRSVTFGL
jgi:deazaflavin-dependent oxidoreductase (nitroreductase family)